MGNTISTGEYEKKDCYVVLEAVLEEARDLTDEELATIRSNAQRMIVLAEDELRDFESYARRNKVVVVSNSEAEEVRRLMSKHAGG